MNFTRLILALVISYLLFMVFSTNANARERLEDVTIQIMDINDDIDDFINRIELPKPAREKITAGRAGQHAQPHVHTDAAEELRAHDHPREDLVAEGHLHDDRPAHENTHEVTAVEIGTSSAEEAGKIEVLTHEPRDGIATERPAEEREALGESSAESREKMKEALEHAGDKREEISVETDDLREKAREHAESRDDD